MAHATVVLVHGAWHDSRCWAKVVDPLTAAGVPVTAVDLPLTSFEADVEAVRAACAAVAGPIVLVGHSYGGVVISEAGRAPNVDHLVFLCALAVDVGHSAMAATDLKDLPGTELGSALVFGADGTVTLDPAVAPGVLYHDCDPADVATALAHLRPMAVACLATVTITAAWRTTPSTYVVCTEDRTLHPELQRALAANMSTVVEWPLGHSPFLNRPELVVELLAGLAS